MRRPTNKVEIYIPFRYTFNYETYIKKVRSVVKELESLSVYISVKINDKLTVPITIKWIPTNTKEYKDQIEGKLKTIQVKTDSFLLRFSAEANLDDSASDETIQDFIYLDYYVSTYLRFLLIYFNLAKPGFFETGQGYIKIRRRN